VRLDNETEMAAGNRNYVYLSKQPFLTEMRLRRATVQAKIVPGLAGELYCCPCFVVLSRNVLVRA
jgi:hypothetical protein